VNLISSAVVGVPVVIGSSGRPDVVGNFLCSIARALVRIFEGRESLSPRGDAVGWIIQVPVNDLVQRYQPVADLIADTDRLEAPTVQATA